MDGVVTTRIFSFSLYTFQSESNVLFLCLKGVRFLCETNCVPRRPLCCVAPAAQRNATGNLSVVVSFRLKHAHIWDGRVSAPHILECFY